MLQLASLRKSVTQLECFQRIDLDRKHNYISNWYWRMRRMNTTTNKTVHFR